ncbi:MAG: cell wall hydrolase/autolysin [Marmoricola sp.]|nr:cell wall hydrolase/autolysin [Marmoricola sp.]
MRPLLRALVVLLAVTVAGTAIPTPAAPASDAASGASSGTLEAQRLTAPTARGTAVRRAEAARAVREARAAEVAQRRRKQPLRSLTIALDPGHQLGNHNHPRQIDAPVPAGGFTKPCNTTGTSTNGGVAEATVNFWLAKAVRKRLRSLGARVPTTRTVNSERRWGPCIDKRGEFGRRVGARLMVSLHADGASAPDRGFHVIAPTKRSPWTTDIADASYRLATALRNGLTAAGVPRSNYIGGGSGLDVRSDLGTLNMSDVPVAMIEIGNMRNPGDARLMTSARGRARYADAVVRGIRTFLGR